MDNEHKHKSGNDRAVKHVLKPKNKTIKQHKIIRPRYKKMGGMRGKIKIFDQRLADKYDIKPRNIIKEKLGESIIDNSDKYMEDMVVLTDEIPYGYIELQVYGKWKDEDFPYESPFVYERKMKFCETTLFICFNSTYDKLIMFSRDNIHPKKYRAKRYSREFVHYVPWSRTLMINTKNLCMDTIKQYYGPIYDSYEDEDNE